MDLPLRRPSWLYSYFSSCPWYLSLSFSLTLSFFLSVSLWERYFCHTSSLNHRPARLCKLRKCLQTIHTHYHKWTSILPGTVQRQGLHNSYESKRILGPTNSCCLPASMNSLWNWCGYRKCQFYDRCFSSKATKHVSFQNYKEKNSKATSKCLWFLFFKWKRRT